MTREAAANSASRRWNRIKRLSRVVLWRHVRLVRMRRRALFVIGGVAIGLVAVIMSFCADAAQAKFETLRHDWPLAPLVVTPAGFALIVFITRRFAKNAKGSGIPQVIAAAQMADRDRGPPLVSPVDAVFKIVLLAFALAVGASAGREGPTVQVGAAIMFLMAPFARHRRKSLLLAGAGAGIAAAFNAPLAGIMFCIEELSRSFESKTSGIVIFAVFVAGATSIALMGDYTYFGQTGATLPLGRNWLSMILAGGFCGFAGGLFGTCLVFCARGLPRQLAAIIVRRPVAFSAVCGFCVALCGIETHGGTFGTGYTQAKAILTGSATVPVEFGVMKFLATLLTASSGIPGGFFAPSLAVGAGLASEIAWLLPGVPIGALTVVCMASYLAGVTQAPLTSLIIVAEMTGGHQMVLILIVNVFLATAISKIICKTSLYHALASTYMDELGPSDDY